MKHKSVIWILSILVLAMGTAVSSANEGFKSGAEGLRYKDLRPGQGDAAKSGQVATIHFIGWLDDNGARGREIYNTRARGEPVSFVIGSERVMKGWNVGVLGMKPGGKRMLLVPPGLAYGKKAVDDIVPANSSWMFHLELISLDKAPDH